MESRQQDQSTSAQQSLDIYKILSRRAFVPRSISTALVIILIIAATFISNMLVSWKDNQSSWVSQIYEAYNNPKNLRPGDLVLFRINDNEKKVGVFLDNELTTGNKIVEQPSASVEISPEGKGFIQPKINLPNIENFLPGQSSQLTQYLQREMGSRRYIAVLIA